MQPDSVTAALQFFSAAVAISALATYGLSSNPQSSKYIEKLHEEKVSVIPDPIEQFSAYVMVSLLEYLAQLLFSAISFSLLRPILIGVSVLQAIPALVGFGFNGYCLYIIPKYRSQIRDLRDLLKAQETKVVQLEEQNKELEHESKKNVEMLRWLRQRLREAMPMTGFMDGLVQQLNASGSHVQFATNEMQMGSDWCTIAVRETGETQQQKGVLAVFVQATEDKDNSMSVDAAQTINAMTTALNVQKINKGPTELEVKSVVVFVLISKNPREAIIKGMGALHADPRLAGAFVMQYNPRNLSQFPTSNTRTARSVVVCLSSAIVPVSAHTVLEKEGALDLDFVGEFVSVQLNAALAERSDGPCVQLKLLVRPDSPLAPVYYKNQKSAIMGYINIFSKKQKTKNNNNEAQTNPSVSTPFLFIFSCVQQRIQSGLLVQALPGVINAYPGATTLLFLASATPDNLPKLQPLNDVHSTVVVRRSSTSFTTSPSNNNIYAQNVISNLFPLLTDNAQFFDLPKLN